MVATDRKWGNGKDGGYKSEAPEYDDGDVEKLNLDATSCIREQADWSFGDEIMKRGFFRFFQIFT